MLLAILSICSAEELEESSEEDTDAGDADEKLGDFPMSPEIAARRQMIKNKILAVGRLQRVFNVLRYVHQVGILITPLMRSWARHREEAEGASELAHAGHNPQGLPVPGASGTLGVRLGADVLGVHDNQWVRSFDEAYVNFLVQVPHCRSPN